MNANNELEQQLESLGNTLRERPRLTDRVMEQVRQLPTLVVEGPSRDDTIGATHRHGPCARSCSPIRSPRTSRLRA